jgi:hypothetical protein
MNIEEFAESLSGSCPPSPLPETLCALWHEAKGDWDRSHRIVQVIETADASWIHAYLHRKEGDLGNASYWYRRAGRPMCRQSLDSEWKLIASALLAEIA